MKKGASWIFAQFDNSTLGGKHSHCKCYKTRRGRFWKSIHLQSSSLLYNASHSTSNRKALISLTAELTTCLPWLCRRHGPLWWRISVGIRLKQNSAYTQTICCLVSCPLLTTAANSLRFSIIHSRKTRVRNLLRLLCSLADEGCI